MSARHWERTCRMTLLRGRGRGLDLLFSERDFGEALAELTTRLAERPGFYRGTPATAVFGARLPSQEQLDALRAALDGGGIALRALSGVPELEAIAAKAGLDYAPPVVARLSETARSLVADFAGARSDIAQRRKRGEGSVRRHASPVPSTPLHAVETPPGTLYHVGTLRGGQALHHVGTIVVVGDVNPGSELVATGDVVVFGCLRGVAHAGAQGDANARVYALQMNATQLRIATSIAVDDGTRRASGAEVACVRDGRIAILPFDTATPLGAPS